MSDKITYNALVNKLDAYNRKKCELDEQKIRAIFDYIDLTPDQYNEKECFKWDRILISVPDQDKFLELQQLEHICPNIEFILNRNSNAYFVCDYEDWRNATKGKGQEELLRILKSNFGFFSKN
jgi:hypothetical protein